MPPSPDLPAYIRAIGTRLGCRLDVPDEPSLSLTMDGDRSIGVLFDFELGLAALAVSITRATTTSDSATMMMLLRQNFPSGTIGGASIVAAGDGGFELVDVIPLGSVNPGILADLLAATASAAEAIDASLVAAHAAASQRTVDIMGTETWLLRA